MRKDVKERGRVDNIGDMKECLKVEEQFKIVVEAYRLVHLEPPVWIKLLANLSGIVAMINTGHTAEEIVDAFPNVGCKPNSLTLTLQYATGLGMREITAASYPIRRKHG